MAEGSGAKVRCKHEYGLNLTLEEVFRRVDSIFDAQPLEEKRLLELKSSFKTIFSETYRFNSEIPEISDGEAAATPGGGNTGVYLEEIVEKMLQEVVQKRKTYPPLVKKRNQQVLAEDLQRRMERLEVATAILSLPPSYKDQDILENVSDKDGTMMTW
ncbi:uncharacterized protein LOC115329527 [Ixodes scapularis]|uniref:uncharacterized protein LOC115329527 n=1 Tax=Ixodes scapularis TaxID=6945 RepID=UPI001C3867C5|nr:uncharacterized protein LOC115329527 [Ixodes scapularis]